MPVHQQQQQQTSMNFPEATLVRKAKISIDSVDLKWMVFEGKKKVAV